MNNCLEHVIRFSSGLAIHEAVHWFTQELKIAPKLKSSGKAEQYFIPSVMEQLRGLPKSFFVVRNVFSIAVRREGGLPSGWPILIYVLAGVGIWPSDGSVIKA